MLLIIKLLNSDKPYILFMNCPNIFSNDLLDILLRNARLSVFDFSDDFVELGYGKDTLETYRNNSLKYARAADIVVTVNDFVRNKYKYLNSNIYVIRNATNYYNFDRKQYNKVDFMEKLKKEGNPIIAYSGIANMSRIDTAILDFLLDRKPNWQFVFVGPPDPKFIDIYMRFNNVHHIPAVNYKNLPDYMHYSDVTIVPFKLNNHTKGNDLLKLHDYLAMGKPIVSTKIGGAKDLKNVIKIAQRPPEFLEEIEKALLDNTSKDIIRRKNVAFNNSWHNRIKELEELLINNLEI